MILVTGATGTIGSELVRLLSSRGNRVRALVRNPDKAPAIRALGAEVAQGDLADPASLDAALQGVRRLFLLSSVDERQAQLQGNAVRAAGRTGVRHIVKLGAASTSLDSPIAVARFHAQTERDIEASGIPYTFLRPVLFMQFLLGHAKTIASQGAFYLPLRDGKVSIVDARDIASVAAAVLTGSGHEGKAYTITGPEALSMAEAADKLGAALGRAVKYVDVPPEAARQAMTAAGIPAWFVEDLLKLMEAYAAGRAPAPSSTVKDLTGQDPHTLDQFAHDFAQAFRG